MSTILFKACTSSRRFGDKSCYENNAYYERTWSKTTRYLRPVVFAGAMALLLAIIHHELALVWRLADDWPTMPDDSDFEGEQLLTFVRSGNSTFYWFWGVNALIRGDWHPGRQQGLWLIILLMRFHGEAKVRRHTMLPHQKVEWIGHHGAFISWQCQHARFRRLPNSDASFWGQFRGGCVQVYTPQSLATRSPIRYRFPVQSSLRSSWLNHSHGAFSTVLSHKEVWGMRYPHIIRSARPWVLQPEHTAFTPTVSVTQDVSSFQVGCRIWEKSDLFRRAWGTCAGRIVMNMF